MGLQVGSYPGCDRVSASHQPGISLSSCVRTGVPESRVKCEGLFCFDIPPGGGREIVSRKETVSRKSKDSGLNRADRFLPESCFVSRGSTAFEILWRGVSPVESVLGELCVSGPGMERSTAFPAADYQHDQA